MDDKLRKFFENIDYSKPGQNINFPSKVPSQAKTHSHEESEFLRQGYERLHKLGQNINFPPSECDFLRDN